jgi:hypothetical protein
MNIIAERVKVTDKSGNPVDIAAALNTPVGPAGEAEGDVLAESEGDADAVAEAEADAEAEETDAKA